MSKQNKLFFRIVGVLIVALMICLCFLGSTFARYTSTASGTGAASIAKWDVAGTASTTFTSTSTISPKKTAYGYSYTTDSTSSDSWSDQYGSTYSTGDGYSISAGYDESGSEMYYIVDSSGNRIQSYQSSNVRSNTSAYIQCMQVTNSGDVDATLSADITKGDLEFYHSATSGTINLSNDYHIQLLPGDTNYNVASSNQYYSAVSGSSISENVNYTDSTKSVLTLENARKMLTYNLYILTSSIDPTQYGTDSYSSTPGYYDADSSFVSYEQGETTGSYYVLMSKATTAQLTVEKGGTLNVYVQVTWKTDVDEYLYGDSADILDTWIGLNVDYVAFTVTSKAVQASEHPADDSSSSSTSSQAG